MILEAGILVVLGVCAGLVLTYGLLAIGRPLLEQRFGIFFRIGTPSVLDLSILSMIIVAALLVALVPAWRAYRNALSDGLTLRV